MHDNRWRRDNPAVDDFEDTKFPELKKAQQLSTSCAYLIKSNTFENRTFSAKSTNCLGRRGSGVQIAPPRPQDKAVALPVRLQFPPGTRGCTRRHHCTLFEVAGISSGAGVYYSENSSGTYERIPSTAFRFARRECASSAPASSGPCARLSAAYGIVTGLPDESPVGAFLRLQGLALSLRMRR